MKAMICFTHPAWVRRFHHIIWRMRERGDEVLCFVAEKDGNSTLLERYGIPYVRCARSTGKNPVEKALLFLKLSAQFSLAALKWKPDIMIGRAAPMLAVAAWVSGKPHLIYEDTEVSKFALRICKHLSTKILDPPHLSERPGPPAGAAGHLQGAVLPASLRVHAGPLRCSVTCGFNPDEPYILVRFVAWNASHDIGKHGLDDEGKIRLVKRLEQYGRVYVSAEGDVPEALRPRLLKTPYELIHHVLAFAQLVFSEGATMASEAAVLGTHALYVNTIVSGSTREQSERFHLMDCFNEGEDRYERAAARAEALLATPDLKKIGLEKQKKLLSEKVDINGYSYGRDGQACQGGEERLMTWLDIGNGWRNLFLLSSALQAAALGLCFCLRGWFSPRHRAGLLPHRCGGHAAVPVSVDAAAGAPVARRRPSGCTSACRRLLAAVGLAWMALAPRAQRFRAALRGRDAAMRAAAQRRALLHMDRATVAAACFAACIVILLACRCACATRPAWRACAGGDAGEYLALAQRYCEDRDLGKPPGKGRYHRPFSRAQPFSLAGTVHELRTVPYRRRGGLSQRQGRLYRPRAKHLLHGGGLSGAAHRGVPGAQALGAAGRGAV